MFDHIVTNGGNLTVLKLVEKYIDTKTGVRPTTQAGYNTVINVLKNDNFGKKRIDTVRISDAKTLRNVSRQLLPIENLQRLNPT